MSSFGPIFTIIMEKKVQTFLGSGKESLCFVKYNDEHNEIRFMFHWRVHGFPKRVYIAFRYIFKPMTENRRIGRCFYIFDLQSKDKTRMINTIRKLQ